MENSNLKKPNVIVVKKPKSGRKSKIISWLRNKFFISTWICNYNTNFAISDLIAGITLGLTIIPESIACALLAGLPSHYGLYSAFIGPLIYLIFGTVEKVLIGPTSLVALVTVQFTIGKPMEFAFVLTLLAGFVELFMGIFQLGFVFDFISMPVIKAFTSATAILVVESQIKVILGIKYLVPGFVNSLQKLFLNLDQARVGDAVMGVCSIIFLICLKYMVYIPFDKSTKRGRVIDGVLKYISLARNALIVFITATIAVIWTARSETGQVPFRLTENVVAGLPQFSFPHFYIEHNNSTYNFVQICSELGVGIFVVPLVSILTNISIAKALTPKGLVNASQELMTLGLCNIIGSGVKSMPTCGAFSRAAISTASGLKTSVAGLHSSILVILALSLLTPYFHYIPESCLAAILMCAIVTLIDFKLPIQLWRDSKRDLFTWISCFAVCVFFGVEVGLFFGIAITAAHLLFLWARPEITVRLEEMDGLQFIKVFPNNGLYFPGVDYLRERTLKACIEADFQVPVVIDCRKITGLDFSAAQGISKLGGDLDEGTRGQALILYQLSLPFQKLIDTGNNILFCETEETLREFLTQEGLRNGIISLKDHVRASIDLGYKVDLV
ncbi:sodium-independent sulfate anion transporter-like [Hermetia illucens]|uniref:sodium-independent sulfate anion transporter-like n=1 Tax=Hermetia illucens TaxID=343691 RepID=UPI0018CC2048|nr:sodium-independent sulfate anion transporter-like [Hermetia illucens]